MNVVRYLLISFTFSSLFPSAQPPSKSDQHDLQEKLAKMKQAFDSEKRFPHFFHHAHHQILAGKDFFLLERDADYQQLSTEKKMLKQIEKLEIMMFKLFQKQHPPFFQVNE